MNTAPVCYATFWFFDDWPTLHVIRTGADSTAFVVIGVAARLLWEWRAGRCPVAIAWDRLQEEPTEAVAATTGTVEDVRDGIDWLRLHTNPLQQAEN